MIGVGPLGPVHAPRPEARTDGDEGRGGGSGARSKAVRPADRAAGHAADLAAERQAWAVLATVDGLGERTFAHLLATHGTARRVLELAASGRLPAP